jgi:HPt (histidine-containing phosphotransfer) domain-containing protein
VTRLTDLEFPMSQHHPHVLDDARLESLVDEIGDRDLVRSAVQTFLDELPARLGSIRAAVASGDRALTKSAAHALGSPAAMLGVTSIAFSTRQLQDAVSSDVEADLDALLAELEAASALGADAMLDYLSTPLPA